VAINENDKIAFHFSILPIKIMYENRRTLLLVRLAFIENNLKLNTKVSLMLVGNVDLSFQHKIFALAFPSEARDTKTNFIFLSHSYLKSFVST
jgi:hypothetical protein